MEVLFYSFLLIMCIVGIFFSVYNVFKALYEQEKDEVERYMTKSRYKPRDKKNNRKEF
jgi:hypothetical protein